MKKMSKMNKIGRMYVATREGPTPWTTNKLRGQLRGLYSMCTVKLYVQYCTVRVPCVCM